MPKWKVTANAPTLIEADTAEEAVEKAHDMGLQWEAVDIDRTAEQTFLVRAVLARVPDAVKLVVGVTEWDNGWFYDHYNVVAIRPDGRQVLLEWDVDHPMHEAMNEALTELSERDDVGRHSSLEIEITDEQRAEILCQGCAALLEPDGWDDGGTPIWSERQGPDWSDAICPAGGTHEPVGGRERAGTDHH